MPVTWMASERHDEYDVDKDGVEDDAGRKENRE